MNTDARAKAGTLKVTIPDHPHGKGGCDRCTRYSIRTDPRPQGVGVSPLGEFLESQQRVEQGV